MRISFQLHPAHLGAAARYIATHNPSIRRRLVRAQVLAAILSGGGMLVFGWVQASQHLYWWNAAIALGVALIAYLVSAYTVKRTYVRRVVAITSDNNPAFQRTVAYEIQAEGLATSSEFGEGVIRWSAIQRITEDTDYIYLSLPGTSTLLIPHTAFASTEQRQSFVRELRTHTETNT